MKHAGCNKSAGLHILKKIMRTIQGTGQNTCKIARFLSPEANLFLFLHFKGQTTG